MMLLKICLIFSFISFLCSCVRAECPPDQRMPLKKRVEQADLVFVGTVLDLNRKMTPFELDDDGASLAFGREGRVLIRRVFKGQRFLSSRFNELSTTARIQSRIPTIILGSDVEGILQVRGSTVQPYEDDSNYQDAQPLYSIAEPSSFALMKFSRSGGATKASGAADEFVTYLREGLLNVHGFHSPSICNSATERFDTRILLLKRMPDKDNKPPPSRNTAQSGKKSSKVTNPQPRASRWRLLAAPVSLNWRTIEAIESAIAQQQLKANGGKSRENGGKSKENGQQVERTTRRPVYGSTTPKAKTTPVSTTRKPLTCAEIRCKNPGETCMMNAATNWLPRCLCPSSCPIAPTSDTSSIDVDGATSSSVCGTDGNTYESMCHLAKAQCETRSKTLQIKHTGSCDVPDPCLATNCTYGAICERSLDGLTSRCICPRHCPAIGAPGASSPLCGTDGRSYASLCHLRKAACEAMRDVQPARLGKCNPCENVECPLRQQQCIVEPTSHQPRCVCIDTCTKLPYSPVCGTNGKIYKNACYLHLDACRLNMSLAIFQADVTTCRQTGISCQPSTCSSPGEECIVNGRSGRAMCVCPHTDIGPPNRRDLPLQTTALASSPSLCPKTVDYVCGDDNNTYVNDCELQRTGCVQRPEDVLLCASIRCNFGAKCSVVRQKIDRQQIDFETPGSLASAKLLSVSPVVTCRCVDYQCPLHYVPVCGSDGRTYINQCQLEETSCRLQKEITVFHKGQCGGCEDLTCPFYSNCTIDPSDGQPQCICPTNCPQAEAVVCGTDNRTYINYCEMTVAACRLNMNISVLYNGYCDRCRDIACPSGRICSYGRCVCQSACVDIDAPVCGTDHRTYKTECHLQSVACEAGLNVTVGHRGACKSSSLREISQPAAFPLENCSPDNCRYGGNCELDLVDGRVKCLCSNFTCLEIRDVVCGSDGKLYGNLCELHKVACQLQKYINKVSLSECQNLEPLPCNGRHAPLTDAFGVEYDCLETSSVSACPPKSFCHRGPTFAVCCPEGASSVKTLCESTDYGCCRDGASMAHGPSGEGCPEWCRCDPIGSFGSLCSLPSGQCMCRPGVVGVKCDQCARGFHSLSPSNHPRGCISCDCDVRGTEPNATITCNPSTGQCLCRPSAAGRRCNRCSTTGQVLTDDGQCISPSTSLNDDEDYGPASTTCSGVVCQFGAACARMANGTEKCSCEALQCSNQLRPVCASDRRSYANKCHMRLSGCRSGRRLQALSFGYCRDSDQNKPTFAESGLDDEEDGALLPLNGNSPIMGSTGPLTPCDQRLNFRCLHGGICYIDEEATARCLCPVGRSGTYCELEAESEQTAEASAITPFSDSSFPISPTQLSDLILATATPPDSRYFVPSFSPRSYVKLKRPRDVSTNLTIEIEVRAIKPSGTVLYVGQVESKQQKIVPGQTDYVAIVLRDGFVEFRFDVGGGMMTIRSARPLTMKQFHVVTAHWSVVEGSAYLQLDDAKWQAATPVLPTRLNGAKKNHTLELSLPVVLGYVKGADQRSTALNDRFGGLRNGFTGCIQSLRISNSAGHTRIYSLVSTSKDVLFGRDIDECGRTGPCVDSPCLNRGTCVATNNNSAGIFCACSPGYSGSRCEITARCDAHRCRKGGTCQLVAGSYPICACPPHLTGPHCQIEKGNSTFIPMLTGRSFIERPPIGELAIQFRIEIWFLATQPNGVIFLAASQRYGRGDFITINLADGFIQAHIRHANWAQQILSEDRIPMNVWTKLVVLRQKKDELILSINGRRSRTQLGRFLNRNGDDSLSVKTKSANRFLRSRMSNAAVGSPAADQAGTLPNSPLRLPLPFFIGGFRHFYDVPAESNVLHHFEGAIQKVSIDEVEVGDVLAGSLAIGGEIRAFAGPPCTGNPCLNGGFCQPQLADFRCVCPSSKVGDLCELDREHLTTLAATGGPNALAVRFNGSTILRFYNAIKRRERQQDTNKVRLRMRSLGREGCLVLIRKANTATADFFIIALRDGYLEVAVNLGSGQTTSLRSNRRINDGNWHAVLVNRQRRAVTLAVDLEPEITVFAPDGTTQLNSNGFMVVGGMDSRVKGLPIAYTAPFVGCMTGLEIDDSQLELHSGRRGSARHPLSLCTPGDDQLQLRNSNS